MVHPFVTEHISQQRYFYSGSISIVITGRDMFDYSTGEPPSNILTVLRALEVRIVQTVKYRL
jgi:hypothetical protein